MSYDGPSYRQSDYDGMHVIAIMGCTIFFVGLLVSLFFTPPKDSPRNQSVSVEDYCLTQRFVPFKDLQAQCIKYFAK